MKRKLECRQLLVTLAICFSSLPAFSQEDTIIINKTTNNTAHNINLYTNASQKVLFFNASGKEGTVYHLLLFRKDKLVKQTRILSRQTAIVNKPEKGNYYFEVFTGDDRIGSGTITVQ